MDGIYKGFKEVEICSSKTRGCVGKSFGSDDGVSAEEAASTEFIVVQEGNVGRVAQSV